MARIGEPSEVVVERKVVPTNRRSFNPMAVAILLAFVFTCVVVFAGSHLGLRDKYPLEKAAENITPQPMPAAP